MPGGGRAGRDRHQGQAQEFRQPVPHQRPCEPEHHRDHDQRLEEMRHIVGRHVLQLFAGIQPVELGRQAREAEAHVGGRHLKEDSVMRQQSPAREWRAAAASRTRERGKQWQIRSSGVSDAAKMPAAVPFAMRACNALQARRESKRRPAVTKAKNWSAATNSRAAGKSPLCAPSSAAAEWLSRSAAKLSAISRYRPLRRHAFDQPDAHVSSGIRKSPAAERSVSPRAAASWRASFTGMVRLTR